MVKQCHNAHSTMVLNYNDNSYSGMVMQQHDAYSAVVMQWHDAHSTMVQQCQNAHSAKGM